MFPTFDTTLCPASDDDQGRQWLEAHGRSTLASLVRDGKQRSTNPLLNQSIYDGGLNIFPLPTHLNILLAYI